ncbi:DNA mismatch repair endonuclease MutL [Candidatus Babeliales bacterium]|nr:DNA mismatch repair endonuclease MutL [Candidatus Babeliales bacterium]
MRKIKILPQEEIWKIAAGEVVERPASVVKELVENSLDAGAKTLSIFIEKAGKKLIRIVDNGFGMSCQDIRSCVLPHATSKITCLDDLYTIGSFGFRGEALASVVAVSKLSIQSRELGVETGVLIDFFDKKSVEESVEMEYGTDVQVKELFFNTPARCKFLKQDETEWNQIQQIVYSFVLGHRGVSFRLYRDGRQILNAPAVKNIEDRACQVWDHRTAQSLIAINESRNGMSVSGAITNARFYRYNRQQIFVFINGRWVKNTSLTSALVKGYQGALPVARFPAACLFFELEPGSVDVNVHPRKEEVRFSHPGKIEVLLKDAVKKTLENEINKQISDIKPAFLERVESKFIEKSLHQAVGMPTEVMSAAVPSVNASELLHKHEIEYTLPPEDPFIVLQSQSVVQVDQAAEVQSATVFEVQSVAVQQEQPRIIGQLFKTYILAEKEYGFILVDQHAAHERILYEKMKSNFEKQNGIKLMFPEVVELDDEKVGLLLKIKEYIEPFGILLEKFGKTQIVVHAAPAGMQSCDVISLIRDVCEFLVNHGYFDSEEFRKALYEHFHSHLACKTAIKAGDLLSVDQMAKLLAELETVENRFQCIHGRPTIWKFEKKEIEKWFRRGR